MEIVDDHEQADRSSIRRTTLTLVDWSVLRATTPSVLLGRLGSRMRSSVGGIGSKADADDDYARSFGVQNIDVFLSHSWSANWLFKYLTLVLHFNCFPCIIATMLTCMVCCGLLWPHYREGNILCDPPRCYIRVFGGAAFIATLTSWQYVQDMTSRKTTLFLDKVCIHQRDPQAKILGIKSIGAILAHSDSMLVTWDKTYFDRLWCTYEMSAFRKANPEGRIIVLPIGLGAFVAAYFAATLVADLITTVTLHYVGWSRGDNLFTLNFYATSASLHYPLFVMMSRLFLVYMQDLKSLKQKLEQFSVRDAKCFCCTCGHIHPDTGETLPCDRLIVYGSIEHWWRNAGDLNASLDMFDYDIRGKFKQYIRRTLGGAAKLPYKFAVVGSLASGLSLLDIVSSCNMPVELRIVYALDCVFLRHPLNIALLITALHRTGERLSILVIGFIFTATYFITLWLSSYLITEKFSWITVFWVLIESVAVAILYFGKRFRHLLPAISWDILPTMSMEMSHMQGLGKLNSNSPGKQNRINQMVKLDSMASQGGHAGRGPMELQERPRNVF